MNLTQPEIIQILRRRRELNQGTFGSRAFDTSFESGRTKIKNIELGRQRPTLEDLKKMAVVLNVPVETLAPAPGESAPSSETGVIRNGGVSLKAGTLAIFPGLAPYVEMLNKAVTIQDDELIDHISEKIAQLFRGRVKGAVISSTAAATNNP